MPGDQLEKLMERVDDLPTLPSIYDRIASLVNDPRSSAMDVENIIREDQALTSKVLNLANSAFYGFPGQIPTISRAVVVLGFQEVKHIVLTATVVKLFADAVGGGLFSCKKFWEHSIGTAVGSMLISKYVKKEKSDEMFVAGLLHDIGKLIHLQYLPEEFELVVGMTAREKMLFAEAEMTVIGHTHAVSGGLLAKRWRLPETIRFAIRFHHQPSAAGRKTLSTSMVHLADILCRALRLGSGGDRCMPQLDMAAWLAVGLSSDDLEPLMSDIEREFRAAAKILLA